MTSVDPVVRLQDALSGRYIIDREIGCGGMATVYLARDLKHNRPVALKVLNPELGAVLGVERFLSEINVTANLQHPNLLPLFDSGEGDGLLFYVMPFVEGESLRARLDRERQLPIAETLAIATAVGNAVDYAHRHGVIHRDLKPENIMMVDGQPLVADFGIALAVSNAGGQRVTQTGLSLGTPQYMSPEQATGDRSVDGRSDVYSLGAIVYEMLAGEPPHTGASAQAIIARVITDPPRSIRRTRDTVPPHVDAAVLCALAKLPADRFATARAFVDALGGVNALLPLPLSTTPSAAVPSSMYRRWRVANMISGAIAVASLFAAAFLWNEQRSQAEPDGVIRYHIGLPSGSTLAFGVGNPLAVSPSGRHVAYAVTSKSGARRLYIKRADELRGREVVGSENAQNPAFSPDGEWVLFLASSQIRKAAVSGGPAIQIGEATESGRLVWTTDGRIVTATRNGLAMASAIGSETRIFTVADSANGETLQIHPAALPDGKHILYTSWAMGGASAARIGIASLEDGSTRILPLQGSYALGVVDGELLYATHTGQIMAAPFDESSLTLTGAPVPVLHEVMMGPSGEAFAAVSNVGAFAYVSGAALRQLSLAAPDGSVQPIIADPISASWPRLSPNADRIALTMAAPGRSDIWIYDLPVGPLTRFTNDGTVNDRPEWTPDGKSILFRSNRGAHNAIWIQTVDGDGQARVLHADLELKIDEGVLSGDGRYLLLQRDSTGAGDLWYRQMSGDTVIRPIATSFGAELSARFSPDGKWIVYTSNETGIGQSYVRPFPLLTSRFQVSLEGGATPLWSRDGKRIYYVEGRKLMEATITVEPNFAVQSRRIALGEQFSFTLIHADYDVMPDGSIVVFRPTEQDAQLVMVHDWRSELRARRNGK